MLVVFSSLALGSEDGQIPTVQRLLYDLEAIGGGIQKLRDLASASLDPFQLPSFPISWSLVLGAALRVAGGF